MGAQFTLRGDPDFLQWESLMRFRLHYEGPLLAAKGDPQGAQVDRRASHKHALRKAFHGQLKHYWDTHLWLSGTKMPWSMFGMEEPPEEMGKPFNKKTALSTGLASIHKVGENEFVPLVCDEFRVLCGLKLLMLRRDKPGGVINARDLDNRLKIIFDALRKPQALNEFQADDTENPMYVLLQDDSLISSVQIETDNLLDPPASAGKDDSYVRLLVEVDIRPYYSSMFSLGFVAD